MGCTGFRAAGSLDGSCCPRRTRQRQPGVGRARVNAQEANCGPGSLWGTVRPSTGRRWSMAECVGDQRRGRAGVNRPAHHPTGPHIEHDCTTDLALASGAPGEVGHPQLIATVAGEAPIDEVAGRGRVRGRCVISDNQSGPAGPHDASTVGTDWCRPQARARARARRARSCTVGPARVGMDLADHISQHRVTDRPQRGGWIHQARNPDTETDSSRQHTSTGSPSAAITSIAANRLVGPESP